MPQYFPLPVVGLCYRAYELKPPGPAPHPRMWRPGPRIRRNLAREWGGACEYAEAPDHQPYKYAASWRRPSLRMRRRRAKGAGSNHASTGLMGVRQNELKKELIGHCTALHRRRCGRRRVTRNSCQSESGCNGMDYVPYFANSAQGAKSKTAAPFHCNRTKRTTHHSTRAKHENVCCRKTSHCLLSACATGHTD